MTARIASRRYFLLGIVALATLFYFYALGRADIVTDESSYATRAIGLIDFDFGIEQPTPWQWVDGLPPWWMHLSFHDHPPLVFLLQHYSIKLFGENPTAIRIPSALAGLAAVVFVYLIGRHISDRQYLNTVQYYSIRSVGLISAALFAVTVNHVWISRIGLQESVLIAFMLASFWTFLRGLENKKWLLVSGVLLGIAFLAKYLALILVPIFATILFIRRSALPPRIAFYFLISLFCFLVVASPAIIYNTQLYRAFGHFDFQFSLLFGQDVAAWQARPGQEVLGSFTDRIRNFVPFLVQSSSPYLLMLAALGLTAIIVQILLYTFYDRRKITTRYPPLVHWPLAITVLWLIPFLVFIGPAPRFLTLLTPWLALAAGYAITQVLHSNVLKNIGMKIIPFAAFAALVAFESFYSYSSVIALDPRGPATWAYAPTLHRQSHSWGFNQLEHYLAGELKGKMPDPALTFEFPFAREILNQARARGAEAGLEPVPWAIIYNDNINLSSTLWTFLRRIVYHGWPVTSAEEFRRGGAERFFRDSGVKRIIFINPTPVVLQDRTRADTPDGDLFETELKRRGAVPRELKNGRGEVAFRVFSFDLR